MTTTAPGQLTDDQAAELAQLRADARTSGDWSAFAHIVMARRASGVTVALIAAAAGVGDNRIRQVCRACGHRPPAVRVPGWVTGREAAGSLEVSMQRLAAAWRAGEAAGVTKTVGWERLWRLEQLPAWWAAQPTGRADAAAGRRAARDETIRELAAGGAGPAEIAQAVGASTATVRRAGVSVSALSPAARTSSSSA